MLQTLQLFKNHPPTTASLPPRKLPSYVQLNSSLASPCIRNLLPFLTSETKQILHPVVDRPHRQMKMHPSTRFTRTGKPILPQIRSSTVYEIITKAWATCTWREKIQPSIRRRVPNDVIAYRHSTPMHTTYQGAWWCKSSSLVGDVAREPVQAFIQPLAWCGASALDVPVALAQWVQPKLVRDLRSVHRVWQILLVSEHEQHGVAKLVLVQHAVQLVARLHHTVSVVTVHHEDETLRILEVVPPQGTDLVLTSHIPHREADVLVLHGLHVEADGWNSRHDLSQLQLVQDGRLTSCVEPDHQYTHLPFRKQPLEQLRECEPHLALPFPNPTLSPPPSHCTHHMLT